MTETNTLHGIMAEFDGPEKLVEAVKRSRRAGFTRLEAYSPVPVEGLWSLIGHAKTKIPLIVLIAGIIGGTGGFMLQYWVSVHAYPLNIGGKPLNSWPSFIPVTFECTILAAALAAVVSMIVLNGFPAPYHPVFNVPNFEAASRDRYFICIESKDPRFKQGEVRNFLQSLKPLGVYDVDD